MKNIASISSFVLAAGMLIFAGTILGLVGRQLLVPGFDVQPDLYLPWLASNGGAFLGVHVLISFVLVLFMLAVPTRLYGRFQAIDADLALAGLIAALIGFGLQLLLSIIDGWGSPGLGRMYVGSSGELRQSLAALWQWMDAWRNGGMKTVSFGALAVWLLISGWLMRRSPDPWPKFGKFCFVYAGLMSAMTLAEILDTVTQNPGVHGLVQLLMLVNLVIFLVIWGVWNGLILWRSP
jgi:hypothetical protein